MDTKKLGKKFVLGLISTAFSFSCFACTADMLQLANTTLKDIIQANLNLSKVTTTGDQTSQETVKTEDVENVELDGVALDKSKYTVQDGKVIIKQLDTKTDHVLLIKIKGIDQKLPFKIAKTTTSEKTLTFDGTIEYKVDNGQSTLQNFYSGKDQNGQLDPNSDQIKISGTQMYWWDPATQKSYEQAQNAGAAPINVNTFKQPAQWQQVTKNQTEIFIPQALPTCAVINADGSVGLPDGKTRIPMDKITKLPDGSLQLPDGKIIYPCKRPPLAGQPMQPGVPVVMQNCVKINQDGSVGLPDGKTVIPADKVIKQADGSVKLPDGTVMKPCNPPLPAGSMQPAQNLTNCFLLNPDGSVIAVGLPAGTIIPADKVVKQADGTIKLPDGTIVKPCNFPQTMPSGQPNYETCIVINADGSVGLPNGTIIPKEKVVKQPDGSIKLPDGSVVYPCPTNITSAPPNPPGCVVINTDGSVGLPNGTIIPADKVVKQSDGSVKLPDGSVVKPCNLPQPMPSGQPNYATCVVLNADGSVGLPNGTIIPKEKVVKQPDGSIKLPDGSVVYLCPTNITTAPPPPPNCVVVNPDGSVGLPNGTVIPADKVVKQSDGSIKLPDGSVVYPCNTPQPASGNNTTPPPPPSPMPSASIPA